MTYLFYRAPMMTRCITILLAGIAATPALSDPNDELTTICENASKMAQTVMQDRQSGVSALEAMDHYMGLARPNQKQLYTDLIVAAYARPDFMSEDGQIRAVRNFADDVWVECMKDKWQ